VLIESSNYGQLTPLVSASLSLCAAAGAILFGFRKRAKWEPSEQDIDKGPQQVASLITAVAIAVMWSTMRNPMYSGILEHLAINLCISCAIFLLAYGFLIGTQTYEKRHGTSQVSKVIGGFSLTTDARAAKESEKLTVQKLFAKYDYDEDVVWPRWSRQIAKTAFVVCYLGLITSGSMALTAGSLLMVVGSKTINLDRPRINVVKYTMPEPIEVGKPGTVLVKFVNSGRTLAKNTAIVFLAQVSNSFADPATPSDGQFEGSHVDVVPGVSFSMPTDYRILNQDDVEAINDGSEHIFVYGVVRYEDELKNVYRTRFCGHYLPELKAFTSCSSFNSSD